MKANTHNDRLVPVEIAGTTCYFNFSLRASKSMMKDFGGMGNIHETIEGGNESDAIDMMVGVYALLIEEGAKYLQYVEKMENPPKFSAEELETIMTMDDLSSMKEEMQKAIEIGAGREIEVKQSPKNGKTAQKK